MFGVILFCWASAPTISIDFKSNLNVNHLAAFDWAKDLWVSPDDKANISQTVTAPLVFISLYNENLVVDDNAVWVAGIRVSPELGSALIDWQW